tara:strand:- start:134 stop:343 length:210 start_codon:yes stop_codon:yes gene_type:complete
MAAGNDVKSWLKNYLGKSQDSKVEVDTGTLNAFGINPLSDSETKGRAQALLNEAVNSQTMFQFRDSEGR